MNHDADQPVRRRAYKYRAYPNKGTRRRARRMMRVMGDIWCNACADRWRSYDAWAVRVALAVEAKEQRWERPLTVEEVKAVQRSITETHGGPINSYKRQYRLIRQREHPEYRAYDAQALQDVLVKLDGSFASYWAKVKTDPEARPPGQKHLHRCITYRQDRWRLDGHILALPKLGRFRLRLHRPIEGRIKTVSITEKNGKWHATFSCEIPSLSGACGPVSAPKSLVIKDLRQDHIPPGGTDPQRSGEHNPLASPCDCRYGGTDPQRSGEHNTHQARREGGSGGIDPQRSGEHNLHRHPSGPSRGGTDPQRSGEHNAVDPLPAGRPGGTDPQRSGESPAKRPVVNLYFGTGFFLRDSEGGHVPQPAFYETQIATVRRLSRALSRKQPGSRNRWKARRTLAKWHERVAAQREAFLWPLARYYAANFQQVIVPEWPLKRKIEYAIESAAARKLCDGAYGRFLTMLRQKCEEFGSELMSRREESYDQERGLEDRVARSEKERACVRKLSRAVKHGRLKAVEESIKTLRQLRKGT